MTIMVAVVKTQSQNPRRASEARSPPAWQKQPSTGSQSADPSSSSAPGRQWLKNSIIERMLTESQILKKQPEQSQFRCGWHLIQGPMADIQPRDMHFDALAEQYFAGKQWKDLNAAEQAHVFTVALRATSFLIDPDAPYMRWWDIVILSCLFFTALVTPFEVGFLEGQINALFFVNRIVDFMFLKDMCMQFVIKLKVRSNKGGKTFILDRRKIARHYLRGWFFLDLISILPYDIAGLFLQSSGMKQLKVLRTIRLFRLLKILRVLRASRMLKRWENRISMPFAHQALARFLVIIIFISHWMACVWGLVGSVLGTNLVCDPGPIVVPDASPAGQSWVTVKDWPPDSPCMPGHMYFSSLHFAVMTITSIGYGDITPTRLEEYLVCILCQFSGAIAWAFIIGSACGVISNMNPLRMIYEQEMDALNVMLEEEKHLGPNLKSQLRQYVRDKQKHHMLQRSRGISEEFSPDLRGELTMEISTGRAIRCVWYLQNLDGWCLVEVAQALSAYLFSRNEQCIEVVGCLGICDRGAVAVAGRVFVAGGTWGEDMIVQWEELQETNIAIALTGAEVLALSKSNLFKILHAYPAASKSVRKAALQIAARRAMRMIYRDRDAMRKDHEEASLRVKQVFESCEVWGRSSSKNSSARASRTSLQRSNSHYDHMFAPSEMSQKFLWEELQNIRNTCTQGLAELHQSINNIPTEQPRKCPSYLDTFGSPEKKQAEAGATDEYQTPPWPNGGMMPNGQGTTVAEIAQKIAELSEQLTKLAPEYSQAMPGVPKLPRRIVPLALPISPPAVRPPDEGDSELIAAISELQ